MSTEAAELFSLDPSIAYLNHGSFGAVPRPVQQAQARVREVIESNPHQFYSEGYQAQLRQARQLVAAAYGCSSSDIVFARSVTEAASTVIESLPLSAGDEVVATSHEYSSNLTALQVQCEAAGARLVIVDRAGASAAPTGAEIVSALTDRTRAVLLSHIASSTALCFPVAEVIEAARSRGIVTIVDGAHAPGQIMVDVDAIDADAYLGALHKWAMFPRGSAFLALRPEFGASVRPVVKSWYYHSASLEHRFSWLGTADPSSWLVADEVFRFHALAEREGWYRRSHQLSLEAEQAVCGLPGVVSLTGSEERVPYMFGVTVPIESARLRQKLRQADVWAWTGELAGNSLLRVSTFVYSRSSDVERLHDELQKVLREGGCSER